MQEDQSNLSRNINLFLNSFFVNQIIDYNVGVITSESRENKIGRLQGHPLWVHSKTPNKEIQLARNLLVGTKGSSTEFFFQPVISAITGSSRIHNRGFYREDAYLVLIYLTDSESQEKDITPMQFYDYLVGLKDKPEKIIVYAAYLPLRPHLCRPDRSEPPPRKLSKFFHKVRATTFELCDPNFGKRLAELGDDLKSRISVFIPLKRFPDVDTIELTYGNFKIPQSLDTGWSYIPEKVGISISSGLKVPDQPPGTRLKISYVPIDVTKREALKRKSKR